MAGGGRVPNTQTSVREEEGRAGKSTRQWIRESSERHSWEDKTREDGTPTEKVPINSGGTDRGGRGGLSHQSAKRSPLSLLTGRLAQLTATERDSIARRGSKQSSDVLQTANLYFRSMFSQPPGSHWTHDEQKEEQMGLEAEIS